MADIKKRAPWAASFVQTLGSPSGSFGLFARVANALTLRGTGQRMSETLATKSIRLRQHARLGSMPAAAQYFAPSPGKRAATGKLFLDAFAVFLVIGNRVVQMQPVPQLRKVLAGTFALFIVKGSAINESPSRRPFLLFFALVILGVGLLMTERLDSEYTFIA